MHDAASPHHHVGTYAEDLRAVGSPAQEDGINPAAQRVQFDREVENGPKESRLFRKTGVRRRAQ
ncbi:MAG: hypothetical protein K2P86_00910 [Xanthobacteraceae bacterium]|nr:hypothetical protein [Xanthobacteraceae bacterium]